MFFSLVVDLMDDLLIQWRQFHFAFVQNFFILILCFFTIALYISGFGNPSVAIVKLDIFEVIRTQNVLTYERYLYCLE